jgi:RecA-family ATPase
MSEWKDLHDAADLAGSGVHLRKDGSLGEKQDDPPPPVQWLDMSSWDNESVPERKWVIHNRVPLFQAGLFSGEGGTGKSIIELHKDVAHVAGKDWLGSMPERGPAFYVGAEDDENEIHIRLAMIAKHCKVTFGDLVRGGLRVLPMFGKDATLVSLRKSGSVETTALYAQLYEAAGDIKPRNISIDTLTHSFDGDEINRRQVYVYAGKMQALAKVAHGSVTVLSHPSLNGINSGSGISGSTAWHGAFRFRQYLKSAKADAGDSEACDNDLRELEFKKNQYGPTEQTIVLRYQNGLFLPERSMSSLDKLAREARVEEVFVRGLRTLEGRGLTAMAGRTSTSYGPTLVADLPEAKADRITKRELEEAKDRLLDKQRIHVGRTEGPPSKASKCLKLGSDPMPCRGSQVEAEGGRQLPTAFQPANLRTL